jgi:predicted RNase H-like nuclease (RuvC/YqgF family)
VEEQIANPMLPPEEYASPQMKDVYPTVPLEQFQEVTQELKEVTKELERKVGALEAKIEEQKKAGLSSESKLESKLSSKTDTKVLSDVQLQLEQKLKVQEQKLKSQEDSIASLNAKLEQYNKKQGCACAIS